jgi:hypothetical protein
MENVNELSHSNSNNNNRNDIKNIFVNLLLIHQKPFSFVSFQ